jgi:two-component system response regulator MprA
MTPTLAAFSLSARPASAPLPRALIVARDAGVRASISDRLMSAGFDVTATEDGLYALMSAHQEPPELVVVARNIKGIDASRLLRLLKSDERTVDVPVLALPAEATLPEFAAPVS